MDEYNDKIAQINVYLTDVINDIMLREAGKGYIRITKEDSMRYAHMSIAIGQFYYLDILQKIYFYFTFDKNVRWALSDKVKEYYKIVMDYLYNQCRADMNLTISLLGPGYLSENSQCAKGSNVSKYIGPYTIGYWKGTNNNYEFLNDPQIAIYNKYKYDMKHNLLDTNRNTRPYLEQLKNVRDTLNKNNDFIANPDLIPTVFNQYKTQYNNIMGINLPTYDFTNDSHIIRLLNATDFFGGNNWY